MSQCLYQSAKNSLELELWKGGMKLRESTVVLRSFANHAIKISGTVAFASRPEELCDVIYGKGPSRTQVIQ